MRYLIIILFLNLKLSAFNLHQDSILIRDIHGNIYNLGSKIEKKTIVIYINNKSCLDCEIKIVKFLYKYKKSKIIFLFPNTNNPLFYRKYKNKFKKYKKINYYSVYKSNSILDSIIPSPHVFLLNKSKQLSIGLHQILDENNNIKKNTKRLIRNFF